MSKHVDLATTISDLFSKIYFYCHPQFDIELSHQAVRALQYIAMEDAANVQKIAQHLGTAHNTASEIVQRLRAKQLVEKRRRSDDERVVEIVLTEDGKRVLQQHTGLDIEKLSTALHHVSPAQCAQITQALELLLQIVRNGDTC